jgi:hypothetical protein
MVLIVPNNTAAPYTFSSVFLSHRKRQDVANACRKVSTTTTTTTRTTTLTPANKLFLQSRYNVISTSVQRIPKAFV